MRGPRGALARRMWFLIALTLLRCTGDECSLVPDVEQYPLCPTIDVASARRAALADVAPSSLVVSANGAALERLLNASWIGGVERLRVCTDERGVRAIARSRRLRALTDLSIATSSGHALDAGAVRALAHSSALRRRLMRLTFAAGDSEAEQSIDAAGVRELAGVRGWKLHVLDLSWNYGIGDSIDALAHSSLASGLDALLLCETNVAASDVGALVDAHLMKLTLLCVPKSPLPDADVARLRAVYGDAVVLFADEAEARLRAP
jgi:hypothetical protein